MGFLLKKDMKKMKKAGFNKIVSTNTIIHKTNKIDVIDLFLEKIK